MLRRILKIDFLLKNKISEAGLDTIRILDLLQQGYA
jgi:hypothetical protein